MASVRRAKYQGCAERERDEYLVGRMKSVFGESDLREDARRKRKVLGREREREFRRQNN